MKILEYHPNDGPVDDKLRFSYWQDVDKVSKAHLSVSEFREFANVGAKVLVYWYKGGVWDGQGDAYWQDDDNCWHYHSLGHCSCYGPVETVVRDLKPLSSLLDATPDAFETYETGKKHLISYIKLHHKAISKLTDISF